MSDKYSNGTEWCDECGHEVGIGSRLSYEAGGNILCDRCIETETDQ